jgi:class 3 adenylate cyclase
MGDSYLFCRYCFYSIEFDLIILDDFTSWELFSMDNDKLENDLLRKIIESRIKKESASGLLGPAYSQPRNILSALAPPPALVAPPPALTAPPQPPPKDLKSPLTKKWNPGFYRFMQMRLKGITTRNSKPIRNITKGLTMPDIESLTIGSAKKMEAAILFFDLENFTSLASELTKENVLFCLNVIIPTMMKITKHWNGEVEKNTGDGIMAIFGTETRNSFLIARDAIESAMAMEYIMLNDIQPKLLSADLPSMNFRIGIEMGEVLISRIGIERLNFITVVGDAANRASKLQELANQNGICIGENVFNCLAPILHQYCEEDAHKDWNWKYSQTNNPYRFFHFNFVWPEPQEWSKIKL